MMKINLKTSILLKLLIIVLLCSATPSSVFSKDTKTNIYQISVKSRDLYLPYHSLGLEKILYSDKNIADIKINKRSGNLKFKMTWTEKPKEEDIKKILSEVSLTPTSISIKKVRSK